MSTGNTSALTPLKPPPHPFRRAVLRGLGVVMPPLLTIVILVWVYNTVNLYVLVPVERGSRSVVAQATADIHDKNQPPGPEAVEPYTQVESGEYIPSRVYDEVAKSRRSLDGRSPRTGLDYYEIHAQITYLKPYVVVPLFLSVFILLLYILGKFLAAGIGRVVWNLFERGILQLPLVRNVYSSVKQVTDFMFSESDIEYTRVVAVEYPRKGSWSLGFVTSESMLDIRSAVNEPVLAVFVPSSPMPVTGWTITFLKSEVVDLNITIDQAFQFIISCGVVVPPQQLQAAFNNAPRLDARGAKSPETDAVQPSPGRAP